MHTYAFERETLYLLCTWLQMAKRKRPDPVGGTEEEQESSHVKKRKHKDERPLQKLVSLLEDNCNSLIAGTIPFFLPAFFF